MQSKDPLTLQRLIDHLRKLPGVGVRTAERFAFDLLGWKKTDLAEFSALLSSLSTKIFTCQTCGCFAEDNACAFCVKSRDPSSLCIIASAKDAYAIEKTASFKGFYHVIEHLVSPLDGRSAAHIRLDRIEERLRSLGANELILAFDSTLEGDATALYLQQKLAHLQLVISRPAFGLPVGTHLEYTDTTTLARSLFARRTM